MNTQTKCPAIAVELEDAEFVNFTNGATYCDTKLTSWSKEVYVVAEESIEARTILSVTSKGREIWSGIIIRRPYSSGLNFSAVLDKG